MLSENFLSLKGEKVIPRTPGAVFVVIEGSDGSGKTTQARLLGDYFGSLGRGVLVTKEPTMDSEAGRRIRRMLYGEEPMIAPRDFQKLYTEDRREHLKNQIIPALNQGKIVICDRYFFATFAHALLDMTDIEELVKMNEGFIMPDIAPTILARPETCMKRLKEKNIELDFFETLEKIEQIDKNYRDLAKRFHNLELIDGEKSIEDVHVEITKILENKLELQ